MTLLLYCFFKKVAKCALLTVLFAQILFVSAANAAANTTLPSKDLQSSFIKRETVAKARSLFNIKLSPNGQHILFIKREKQFDVLWTQSLNNDKQQRIFTGNGLREAYWSANGKDIVVLFDRSIALVKAEQSQMPITIAKLSSKKREAFLGVSPALGTGVIVHRWIHSSKHYQLVQINDDGQEKVLFSSPYQILNYLFTSPLDDVSDTHELATIVKPRLAAVKVYRNNQTEIHVLLNNIDYKAWAEAPQNKQIHHIKENALATLSCDIGDPCQMVSLDVQTHRLYMLARFEGDKAKLHEYLLKPSVDESSLLTKRELSYSQELGLTSASRFDADFVFTTHEGKPSIVAYKNEFKTHYGLDDTNRLRLQVLHQYLDNHTEYEPSKRFIDIQMSDNGKHWLVFDNSAGVVSGSVYFLAHSSNEPPLIKRLSLRDEKDRLQNTHIGLDKYVLNYTVSDGMSQHAYVTMPKNSVPNTLPLVVMPHGGPWGRDDGAKDMMAEFIASRGYIVLQPNFRSSVGLGRYYAESANKDYGDGRVQQDIIDSMQYALSQGIGDATKLGIVGHSFGGFSVLSALSFTPDLFHFGFAGAPPSDLAKSIQFLDKQDYRRENARLRLFFAKYAADISDPKDIARLSAKSPDLHWQNIKKPLYIWAGKFDDRVDVHHVREYASLLWNGEQSISLFIDPKAGHSPRTALQMDAYLYILEYSLAKHLGGDFEDNMSNALQTYMKRHLSIDENQMLVK